jgi:hypothetical protein
MRNQLSILIQKPNATISKRQVQSVLGIEQKVQLSKSCCPAYLLPTFQNVLNRPTVGKKGFFSEGLQSRNRQHTVTSTTHKYLSILSGILFYFYSEFFSEVQILQTIILSAPTSNFHIFAMCIITDTQYSTNNVQVC